MSQSIRKVLGKEQYKLIKERNSLYLFLEMNEVYGGMDENELKEGIKELSDKIETLKLLRVTLKKSDAHNNL